MASLASAATPTRSSLIFRTVVWADTVHGNTVYGCGRHGVGVSGGDLKTLTPGGNNGESR